MKKNDHVIDPAALRRALGMFATGIAVVTTRSPEGKPVGLTVNSFNSVSLEPPLVLWSLARSNSAFEVFEGCSHYAVNILATDQQALSNHFASKVHDRFKDLAWHEGLGGAPLLDGCCAHFEVRNTTRVPGGDHLVFIGEVERFGWHKREPLIYFGGHYRQLAGT